MSTSLPGNLAVSPTIPLTDPLRAAYNDLYDKLEAQYQGTADAVVLEAIGPMRDEVKNILTKDDMCRFSQDSALFAPLLAQINSTNDGLKTLKSQIASTASHFAMAGDILAAVSKVFGLLGIA